MSTRIGVNLEKEEYDAYKMYLLLHHKTVQQDLHDYILWRLEHYKSVLTSEIRETH